MMEKAHEVNEFKAPKAHEYKEIISVITYIRLSIMSVFFFG